MGIVAVGEGVLDATGVASGMEVGRQAASRKASRHRGAVFIVRSWEDPLRVYQRTHLSVRLFCGIIPAAKAVMGTSTLVLLTANPGLV
jgi:hypothetical protein